MAEVKGEVQNITWTVKSSTIYLKGYAFIQGVNINQKHKVKKSIVIANNEKKYSLPLENTYTGEVTEAFGNKQYNYNFAGFAGRIDLSVINEMQAISEGIWEISLYINAGGVECVYQIPMLTEFYGCEESLYMPTDTLNSFYKCSLIKSDKGQALFEVTKTSDIPEEYESIFSKKSSASIYFNRGVKLFNSMKKKIIKKRRQWGNRLLTSVYKRFLKKKVVENRVTFLSDSRKDLSGNFEFVYEELRNRGNYEIKTILKPSITTKSSFKEKVRLLLYLTTSKYIFLDDYYPQIYKYKIKDEIEVIQLWHATGAFKTFGFSRLGKKGGPGIKSKNHRNYTKAIVSSEEVRRHYAEAFGISEHKVISTGIPRTDIFFDEEYKKNKIASLYERYPSLKNKKVIMFAPTFRGNGQATAYYEFEKLDIHLLYEAFKDEYIFAMKLHPFIKNRPVIDERYKNFVLDLTHEREINDLLFVSDLVITDYSSVCFEYSLLNRPMIFFAYDLDEYISKRDFYYPYESFVPGPIIKTTEDLVTTIKNEDYEIEKVDAFRKKFFTHLDGKSTARVVDLLVGKEY